MLFKSLNAIYILVDVPILNIIHLCWNICCSFIFLISGRIWLCIWCVAFVLAFGATMGNTSIEKFVYELSNFEQKTYRFLQGKILM